MTNPWHCITKLRTAKHDVRTGREYVVDFGGGEGEVILYMNIKTTTKTFLSVSTTLTMLPRLK